MHEGIEPIEYYHGIFDKYKEDSNLDSWMDFPELMWGLGFEMDCEKSYQEFLKICGLDLKEPKNERGYKVIVLLTGTIEKLRQQTQQRIDEGFVGSDSSAMMKQKEDGLIVGVGKYDSSIRPMVLTSTADDFKTQNAKNLNFDLRNINGPVIFVVKKNSAVLKRLNKWLSTYNQNGTNPINHSV